MYAKVHSAVVFGLEAVPIEVEAELVSGYLPSFKMVGLPGQAVQEAKERVMSAVRKVSGKWPWKKVIVNLAPAYIPKAGSSFDLPIAMGILQAAGEIRIPEKTMFVGELTLEGKIRAVNGVLAIAEAAKKAGFERIYVPYDNAGEGLWVDIEVYGVKNLGELVRHFNGWKLKHLEKKPFSEAEPSENRIEPEVDISEIRGQENAKKALEIAAAGMHNLLMIGPPGGGKTMLAKALPGILPPLTKEEAIEVTRIYSVSGKLPKGVSLIRKRPCRQPHHTASTTALVGGGTIPHAGEISLAHKGILFLDEFAEFPRQNLDALRQPMEDKTVTISRAAGNATFPAAFILIAAMNPCPCGWRNDSEKMCECSRSELRSYDKKLSGPLLDRIDLSVYVDRVKTRELGRSKTKESSAKSAKRVQKAVEFRKKHNFEPRKKSFEKDLKLARESKKQMLRAQSRFKLSARSYFKAIKVARTIANLEQSLEILPKHIQEALQFRFEQRKA